MLRPSNINYITLDKSRLDDLKRFSDRWIGKNYFTIEQLEKVLELSFIDERSASLLAYDKSDLVGIRITLINPSWQNDFKIGLSFDKWNLEPKKVAYFKSLFIASSFQKMGLGKSLSLSSIKKLKEMGFEGVVCHSWLESPGNGSQIYLEKMGFTKIFNHKNLWYNIDYECIRCRPKRCKCTAIEMIKYI
mgnify:CR=1 FL=1